MGLPIPLSFRPSSPLNDEQLMLFAQRNEPYRIERNVNGEIEMMTPVGGKGGRLESYVIRQLDIWAEEHGGASFSSGGGFSLPDGSMRCPDAAWLSEDRWNSLSDQQQEAFPPLCPDFIIKVASSSDSRKTVVAKMHAWVENGAKLAWMIDAAAGTLTIFRPGHEPMRLMRPDCADAQDVVPGFHLSLSRFWRT